MFKFEISLKLLGGLKLIDELSSLIILLNMPLEIELFLFLIHLLLSSALVRFFNIYYSFF